jgi:hypothetical protein
LAYHLAKIAKGSEMKMRERKGTPIEVEKEQGDVSHALEVRK